MERTKKKMKKKQRRNKRKRRIIIKSTTTSGQLTSNTPSFLDQQITQTHARSDV